MTKISKVQAKKIYNNGGMVYLCASKLRDEFAIPCNRCEVAGADENDRIFESIINNYRYYNCNRECGMGVNFFINV